MILTKAFKNKHPAGTRVRHPLYGAATIKAVTESYIEVEWDSPMAQIEQDTRIPASTIPYMTRIVEVRTPEQARSIHAQQNYQQDEISARRINTYVAQFEKIIDSVLDNPNHNSFGAKAHSITSRGVDHFQVVIPFRTEKSHTDITFFLGQNLVMKMDYYDSRLVAEALASYYGAHGWKMDWDPSRDINGMSLTHESVSESVKAPTRVNNTVVKFSEAFKGNRRTQ